MTLEQLNEYARLRRELEQAVNLKAAMESAAGLKVQVITGLPHAPGYRNKLGAVMPKVLDELPRVDAQIESLRKKIGDKESEITRFIDTLPDIQTRTIFRLRFLEGFTWAWIAFYLGGGNTANAVKKRCYRDLD